MTELDIPKDGTETQKSKPKISIHQICRICLSADKKVERLVDDLESLYDEFCNFSVGLGKKYACTDCTNLLITCHYFRKQCEVANKMLLKWNKMDEDKHQRLLDLQTKLKNYNFDRSDDETDSDATGDFKMSNLKKKIKHKKFLHKLKEDIDKNDSELAENPNVSTEPDIDCGNDTENNSEMNSIQTDIRGRKDIQMCIDVQRDYESESDVQDDINDKNKDKQRKKPPQRNKIQYDTDQSDSDEYDTNGIFSSDSNEMDSSDNDSRLNVVVMNEKEEIVKVIANNNKIRNKIPKFLKRKRRKS